MPVNPPKVADFLKNGLQDDIVLGSEHTDAYSVQSLISSGSMDLGLGPRCGEVTLSHASYFQLWSLQTWRFTVSMTTIAIRGQSRLCSVMGASNHSSAEPQTAATRTLNRN